MAIIDLVLPLGISWPERGAGKKIGTEPEPIEIPAQPVGAEQQPLHLAVRGRDDRPQKMIQFGAERSPVETKEAVDAVHDNQERLTLLDIEGHPSRKKEFAARRLSIRVAITGP